MDDEKGLALGTHRGFRRALNKLNEFNSSILFSDINYQLIKDFDNFMIGQGLKVNSRATVHTNVKKFMNIAISKELLLLKNMPYNTLANGGVGKFSIGKEDGTKIPLNFEERERFEKLEYPNSERYEKFKDAFLFTCYTGLRHCDVAALNFSHLVYTSKGYSIDLHKMIKTKRPVYLELFTLFEGKPEKILRKYLFKIYGTDNYDAILKTGDNASPIFPSIHQPDFNTSLKVMAKDAKIQKRISTHCGRHTFGTQMAILTNGNQYLVMDLLGHSKPNTTMIYVKLGERMVNRQLRNVNWAAYDEKTIEKEQVAKQEVMKEVPDQNKVDIPGEEDNTIIEILDYLYEEVIPSIEYKADETIPFAIDTSSLKEYVSLLPFSTEDLIKYQENPFILQSFVIGMKYAKYVDGLETAINDNEWLKDSCLKIQLRFLPVPKKGLQVINI